MESLVGRRFGRWTVVARVAKQGKHVYWQCRCDCGTVKSVETYNLLSGRSMRCLHCTRDRERNPQFTHGLTQSREYEIWCAIKQRCYYPKHTSYESHGARGITVCDRWRHSFENFLADMGRRPSDAHTIERRDNDGPYSPENCCWATNSEQQRNRRTNVRIAFQSQERTVAEWCDILGLKRAAVYQRLADGWSVERALTEPLRHR